LGAEHRLEHDLGRRPGQPPVIRTIPAGTAPLGVLSTANGVFVSMSEDGAVWRLDTTG
jgi:hypothetical protein